MGEEGFVKPGFSKQKMRISEERDAKSDAAAESPIRAGASDGGGGNGRGGTEASCLPRQGPTMPLDADLARVVAEWASLPIAIRRGIVAMVAASGGGAS
jgi:hypothetical protein